MLLPHVAFSTTNKNTTMATSNTITSNTITTMTTTTPRDKGRDKTDVAILDARLAKKETDAEKATRLGLTVVKLLTNPPKAESTTLVISAVQLLSNIASQQAGYAEGLVETCKAKDAYLESVEHSLNDARETIEDLRTDKCCLKALVDDLQKKLEKLGQTVQLPAAAPRRQRPVDHKNKGWYWLPIGEKWVHDNRFPADAQRGPKPADPPSNAAELKARALQKQKERAESASTNPGAGDQPEGGASANG